MKNLVIEGRRWFQSTWGNTYHTVSIQIDGKHVYTAPMEYGYGDQYIQTAERWLIENRPRTFRQKEKGIRRDPLWMVCRDKKIFLHSYARDGLKRDLHR